MTDEAKTMARVLAQSGCDLSDEAAAVLVLMNARFACREIVAHMNDVQIEAQVLRIVEAWS